MDRPERNAYRAVRNLVVNEFCLGREAVVELVKGLAADVIRGWLYSDATRNLFIAQCRDLVRTMAGDIIRRAAQEHLVTRVRICVVDRDVLDAAEATGGKAVVLAITGDKA
jgi:16S rRNA C967 or C1407 C5-methylase (RsmB/RsmF family)